LETPVSLLERLSNSPTEDDWRLLLDVYQPLLRTWVARGGVAPSDADDLVQEVLLVVFREVSRFERRGPGAFRGWLRTILVHRVRNYCRARGNRPAAAGDDSDILRQLDELEARDSALSRQWDREHDEEVAAALLRLVQRDFTAVTWEAFRRYALEGEAPEQVAEQLGLSINAVLLGKSRVLKRLRQELAGFVE